MNLQLTAPRELTALFTVQPDMTEWKTQIHRRVYSKKNKAAGQTPDRARASFDSWSRSLAPISAEGHKLERMGGVA